MPNSISIWWRGTGVINWSLRLGALPNPTACPFWSAVQENTRMIKIKSLNYLRRIKSWREETPNWSQKTIPLKIKLILKKLSFQHWWGKRVWWSKIPTGILTRKSWKISIKLMIRTRPLRFMKVMRKKGDLSHFQRPFRTNKRNKFLQ